MDDDESLEDDGPCGIAQTVLQGSKDLGDACLTGVSGYKDMFNVFRLRGRELFQTGSVGRHEGDWVRVNGEHHLYLGGALDGLFPSRRHGVKTQGEVGIDGLRDWREYGWVGREKVGSVEALDCHGRRSDVELTWKLGAVVGAPLRLCACVFSGVYVPQYPYRPYLYWGMRLE